MIVPNSKIILLKTPMELNDSNTLSFSSETAKYNYFHALPKSELTGEFICNGYEGAGIDTAHCVIMTAWNPIAHGSAETEWEGDNAGSFLNGIYQGCDFFVVGPVDEAGTISYFMKLMANQSKLDSVIGLFMLPDELINYSTTQSDYTWLFHPDGSVTQQYPVRRLTASQVGSSSKVMVTKNITKNYSTIDGYTPKNKKLFTSQFNYLMVSNNSGANFTYNYEDFSTNNCEFRVDGAVAPAGSIKCFPRNYRGITNGVEYGIVSGKYPICSFTGDMYTNWLTQNSVNFSVGNFDINLKPGDTNALAGGLSILGGLGLLATGGGSLAGVGAILSGGMQIANSMGEIQRHEKTPPMFRGNVNAGDVTYAQTWLDFTFYKMSIKSYYARLIDDYFTMYGYKVNSLEVINPHKRTYFDYIKTIGCNIIGNIPQTDMQEIRNLFDNGLTIWHDPSKFLDYSVTNSIIS